MVVILLEPSLITNELGASFGINPTFQNILILANLMILAIPAFNNLYTSKLQKNILNVFFLMIIYLVILGFTIYSGTNYSMTGNIRRIVFIILIYIIMNDTKFNIPLFIKIFLLTTTIIALLSIFQWIGFIFKIVGLSIYYLKTYDPGGMRYFNFGGFVDKYDFFGSFYRNQSFWTEPAKYGQFLMIPIFLSIYKYFNSKTKKNLFISIVLTFAFITTFSVANFFGALVGLGIFFWLNKSEQKGKHTLIMKFTMIIVFLITVFSIYSLFDYSNENTYTSAVLGKSTTTSLTERYERVEYSTSVLETSFFGDPTIRDNWKKNPTALGLAIVSGGIPLVVLCFIFIFQFYGNLLYVLAASKYKFVLVSSIAYFIPFSWYGNYIEIIFLFHVVFFTIILKMEENGLNLVDLPPK